MKIGDLLKQSECEWLDFKEEHHTNKADLLHDLLCLANAYSTSDRYLLFGVDNGGKPCGFPEEAKRRTDNEIQDFLRQARFNRIPTCRIESEHVDGLEIDVLTIRNRPDKPFFLEKDYVCGKAAIRWGVVYTRIGSTNVPLKESAPEDHVELMWRERFGLALSPLERAKKLLDEPAKWRKPQGDEYLYHVDSPEFTIVDVDGKAGLNKLVEPWTKRHADPEATRFEVQLRYLTTILGKWWFASCDGDRFRIPLPRRDSSTEPARYVISKSEIPWKITQIYDQRGQLDHALSGIELVE